MFSKKINYKELIESEEFKNALNPHIEEIAENNSKLIEYRIKEEVHKINFSTTYKLENQEKEIKKINQEFTENLKTELTNQIESNFKDLDNTHIEQIDNIIQDKANILQDNLNEMNRRIQEINKLTYEVNKKYQETQTELAELKENNKYILEYNEELLKESKRIPSTLSKKKIIVLELLKQQVEQKEIARQLKLSEGSITYIKKELISKGLI